METNKITELIIGKSIEIHSTLGPGLLESAYQKCLEYELLKAGLKVQREIILPVIYKELLIEFGYKMDLLVEDSVVIELKSVEQILPVHEAQILTYLKLSSKKVGLLINFNETLLKKGIRRFSI
ncbi:MAG TPA: GxxExxY protein [Ignavibacteria bacterium]|nr:GxxExxY protein [Ignavibacteria bacterium]